jgi:hypothetical protein
MSDQDDLLAVRQESKRFIEQVADLPYLGDVLDVGPMQLGGVFGKMPEMYVDARYLFDSYKTLDYTGQMDYIADIGDPGNVPENIADTILLLNVLEHVPYVWRVPLSLWLMLRPNGRIMVLTPWRLRLHGPSPDCWRLTDEALRVLFAPPRWGIELLEKRGGWGLDPAVWVMIARAYAG